MYKSEKVFDIANRKPWTLRILFNGEPVFTGTYTALDGANRAEKKAIKRLSLEEKNG